MRWVWKMNEWKWRVCSPLLCNCATVLTCCALRCHLFYCIVPSPQLQRAKNNHHSFTPWIFGMFSLLASSTNTTQFYRWREHSFTLALQKREKRSLVQFSLIEQKDDDDGRREQEEDDDDELVRLIDVVVILLAVRRAPTTWWFDVVILEEHTFRYVYIAIFLFKTKLDLNPDR